MRLHRFCFALAALFSAGAACAQDGSEVSNKRTPEGARLFLTEVANRFKVTAGHWVVPSMVTYNVTRVHHEDDCTTVFEGIPRLYVLRKDLSDKGTFKTAGDAGDPNLFASVSASFPSYGLVGGPYRVKWGLLGNIVQNPVINNYTVGPGTILLKLPEWELTMGYPTGELASRAILAMETLKAACDPAAGTGF